MRDACPADNISSDVTLSLVIYFEPPQKSPAHYTCAVIVANIPLFGVFFKCITSYTLLHSLFPPEDKLVGRNPPQSAVINPGRT